VTVAVKYIIHVKGIPSGYNTPRYEGVVRPADAASIDLLRGAEGQIPAHPEQDHEFIEMTTFDHLNLRGLPEA
jgi:hypothetical protein